MVSLRTALFRIRETTKQINGMHAHFPTVDFVEQGYIMMGASLLQRVPAKRSQHVGNAAPTPVVTTCKPGSFPLNSLEFVDVSLHVRTLSKRSIL